MAEHWHRRILEGNATLFAVLTTVGISIGGLVEIAPMFTASMGTQQLEGVTPYTPLEQAGRDIYVREGCYLCHSQMVRPMRAETLRYGPWSRGGEYAYDHPFQLGSRRIGPDLHRVGGKYPDSWHYDHMNDPRKVTPGSVMPAYPWLIDWKVDPADVQASLTALSRVGVPYTQEDIDGAPAHMQQQGTAIAESMKSANIEASWDDEIIALTAYLQRLGVDGRPAIEAQEQAAMGGE